MKNKIRQILKNNLDGREHNYDEAVTELLNLYSVMPRILHFEDEFGRLFDADSELILFEGTPNEVPKFYVLDYGFQRNYLKPIYEA